MFEDIQVFCAVAKHQSFAKAARELGMSTPVVTRRLARLEHELATRLLNRTTRQVTLTEAGTLFYSDVSDLLQTFEASKENVKSLTSTVAGTLKVGMPSSFSHFYVSRAIHCFLKQYPNIKLHIVTGPNLLNLLNEGFDLVINCGDLPNSSYYYKKIGTMKRVVCASPEYLKKHGTPKHYSDLEMHNCMDHRDMLHSTWVLQDKNNIINVPVKGNISANNGMDLRNLAVSGIGIVYLPQYLVQEELQSGRLVSILDEYQPANHDMFAIYPNNKYLGKKTKLFLDFVSGLLTSVCVGKCD